MSAKYERWNFLETVFFFAFLFWSGAGLFFTTEHVTPAVVATWHLSDFLTSFIDFCLQTGDPVLIILAFANTHLHAVRQWSASIARNWGIAVLVISFAVETYGAHSGFPFGDYHYTDRFGPIVGLVPFTIPLAWHVVVTNSLFVVRALAPYISRLAEAGVTALICTAYDFILEPFATTLKGYWIWKDGEPPPLNYLAWFVISALLVRIFAPTPSSRYPLDFRPWLILILTILIFIAGRLQ